MVDALLRCHDIFLTTESARPEDVDDSLFFIQGGRCDPSLGQVPFKNSVLDEGNFNLKYGNFEIFRRFFGSEKRWFFWGVLYCIHTLACNF